MNEIDGYESGTVHACSVDSSLYILANVLEEAQADIKRQKQFYEQKLAESKQECAALRARLAQYEVYLKKLQKTLKV